MNHRKYACGLVDIRQKTFMIYSCKFSEEYIAIGEKQKVNLDLIEVIRSIRSSLKYCINIENDM
jgi:hypothetical protein